MNPKSPISRILLVSLLAQGAVACGSASTTAPQAAVSPGEVLIAQPCPELQQNAGSIEGVLVEWANVPASTTVSDLSKPVQAKQVAKALITSDADVDGTWVTSDGSELPLGLKIADLPSDPSSSVAIEISVGRDNPKRLEVQAQNQQSTVLPAGGGRAIAVTPYFIFTPKTDSLKSFAECTSARRGASLTR